MTVQQQVTFKHLYTYRHELNLSHRITTDSHLVILVTPNHTWSYTATLKMIPEVRSPE